MCTGSEDAEIVVIEAHAAIEQILGAILSSEDTKRLLWLCLSHDAKAAVMRFYIMVFGIDWPWGDENPGLQYYLDLVKLVRESEFSGELRECLVDLAAV